MQAMGCSAPVPNLGVPARGLQISLTTSGVGRTHTHMHTPRGKHPGNSIPILSLRLVHPNLLMAFPPEFLLPHFQTLVLFLFKEMLSIKIGAGFVVRQCSIVTTSEF